MSSKKNKIRVIFVTLAVLIFGVVFYYLLPFVYSNNIEYKVNKITTEEKIITKDDNSLKEIIKNAEEEKEVDPVIIVTHINTPKEVKALYMSSWVAGSPSFRNTLVKMINNTELNAVVIDIKDSTGRVSFEMDVPLVKESGSIEKRISNIRELTNMLHQKNIYIIGRISVFQDPYMTKKEPKWAVTKKSDGSVWKDKKGLSFLDPAKKEVHDYTLAIAKGAYEEGFDEINFDYIRYPSDGNISDINYHLKEGETRSDNIEKFFKYLSTEIKKDINIPISADLFGLTTEAQDDMGIGQVWEKAIPYFDFVCPMVYPSHYPSGYAGYKNPALYPYEVVNKALISATNRNRAINQNINKIRPWIQDFNIGATYTKEMVEAQIKASYNNGLNSWMLWDPSNKYTPSALKLETKN